MFPLDFLPSQYALVPNLGTLNRLLFYRTLNADRAKLNRITEQLPYYLRGACESWERLEKLRIAAAELFSQRVGANGKWLIAGDGADAMAYAVDGYLTNLHRAVEGLILYMNRCPRHVGLPLSLHATVDGVRKNKYPHFDSHLRSLTLRFWDEMGQKVKGYRDQGSHFGIVPSSCLMFYQVPTGNVGLQLLLPDRWDVKGGEGMGYVPGVPVIGFMCESLANALQFINRAVERMIDIEAGEGEDPRGASLLTISKRGGKPIDGTEINPIGECVPY